MTRTRSQVSLLLAGLTACATTAVPAAAQNVTLRWKYEQGSEMVYRTTNQQEMDMSTMGVTMATDQIQTMRWRVADVAPNGDATIMVTTERIQVDMQGMTGNIKYDSQTDTVPDDPQARMFAAMAGLSYTMVIGPDGTVRSVQGLDELREMVLSVIPAEQAGAVQAMAGEMFSEESMTRMMQQTVQLFPEEPVGPADSWNNSFSMAIPMFGTMTTNMTFTLSGIEEREGRTVAVISNTGTIVMGSDASSPLPMTFDVSDTKLTGSINFDVDRGITLSADMSTVMQMAVDAAGQQMAIGMTQTMKLELLEYISGR